MKLAEALGIRADLQKSLEFISHIQYGLRGIFQPPAKTDRILRHHNANRKKTRAGCGILSLTKIKTLNFAAIDFETANYNPSSICSLGMVVVRNGRIVEKIYRLIRPEPEWYSDGNTTVHGLTAADTENEPVFPFVWKDAASKIAGLPLVAHNSTFDKACLRAAHRVYRMDYPDYEFHCTCRTSRRVFGKILPNHQLHTVAAHCGFDSSNHHHALANAEACAAIAMMIMCNENE